jgi:hypothetical protein
MDRDTFIAHLTSATEFLLPFTRSILLDDLPGEHRFLIVPNASYDANLEDGERVFPEDDLPPRRPRSPMTTDEVVQFLWRDGLVPEWVNMSVRSYDDRYTHVELLCCGRFTAEDRHLYHRREGWPPFHVTSPALPPGWESVGLSGRFRLRWDPPS